MVSAGSLSAWAQPQEGLEGLEGGRHELLGLCPSIPLNPSPLDIKRSPVTFLTRGTVVYLSPILLKGKVCTSPKGLNPSQTQV